MNADERPPLPALLRTCPDCELGLLSLDDGRSWMHIVVAECDPEEQP